MDQSKTKEALVLHYFLTEENNTMPNLSKLTGVNQSRVSTILNKYLKTKKINT
jgi:DNA-binding MarR family transcriptional regulator